MKYFYWWLVMIVLGLAGLVVIVMFESITLDNDSEYYVLKEAMEAAMLESVDVVCYNISTEAVDTGCDGQLKIAEQKFVENFTRRFASTISGDVDEYEILFYDIVETPPKASVVINSSNKSFTLVSDSIDIKNGLTGILEAGYTQSSTGSEYEIEVPVASEPVVPGTIIGSGSSSFVEQGTTYSDSDDYCPKVNGKDADWCADPEGDLKEGDGESGECSDDDATCNEE